jgi:hypothetical protein
MCRVDLGASICVQALSYMRYERFFCSCQYAVKPGASDPQRLAGAYGVL